ncbi:MAG TPA: bifunctional hydroxymethylpyrimidine kinase/phosphomethylpyrimidine kinase [Aliidongia sp.]|nr:bifunctional hydroxymethylpyrimidine kinase/phosphomethylpyrimidine kinase [Aliidongia sp.]
MSLARILICAGSDSGGGAGIQADIKTVTALGGYAMTAVTALTAQNTKGVQGIFPVEPDFIRLQMRAVLTDLGADAVKTGMLGTAPVIDAVVETLAAHAPKVALIVDPVMVAKGGASLLANEAVAAMKARLLPRADLLTPNLPEAEVLLGTTLPDLAAMCAAAAALQRMGPRAVLLKGGHFPGATVHDVLASADGVQVFDSGRIETRHTHGTGCTLASAIATGLGQGMGLTDAVIRARAYVLEAIRTAPGLGHGHGPLNHGHTVRCF